jgi:hypothetical protein
MSTTRASIDIAGARELTTILLVTVKNTAIVF